jgi:transposase
MSDTFSKIEVITGVARRRRFSTELKVAVVAETMQPGMSISYVARRHGLSPSLVFRWSRLMSGGGKEAVRADDEVVAASEVRRLEERVASWSGCWAARRWKSRSSRRRSTLRGQKNRPCCRTRRCRVPHTVN